MAESTTSADEHDISRALSTLSFATPTEDWDRSLSDIEPPSPTSSKRDEEKGKDGLPAKRSLSDLMRLYAQKTGIELTDDDERRLREELGNWINSDLGPYEALSAATAAVKDKDKAASTRDSSS